MGLLSGMTGSCSGISSSKRTLDSLLINALRKALNVNSYHDAAIVMKARFSGFIAYYDIKALLDRNKIAYEQDKETIEYEDPLNC